jgi:peptidoglycan LD-endopeptidase CwlK
MLDKASMDRLAKVYPELRDRWVRAHDDMLKLHGYQVLCSQGLRTWEEQAKLYAIGRTKPGKVVTNAKPGSSWHNFGLAVDAYFAGKDPYLEHAPDKGKFLWSEWGRLGKVHGLVWGGDWESFPDRPHHQYTRGLKLTEARSLYKAGGLACVWDALDEYKTIISQTAH